MLREAGGGDFESVSLLSNRGARAHPSFAKAANVKLRPAAGTWTRQSRNERSASNEQQEKEKHRWNKLIPKFDPLVAKLAKCDC